VFPGAKSRNLLGSVNKGRIRRKHLKKLLCRLWGYTPVVPLFLVFGVNRVNRGFSSPLDLPFMLYVLQVSVGYIMRL